MSQKTTKLFRCCYFKLTTCFGTSCGPSSGQKIIYSRKLYSIIILVINQLDAQDFVFQ